MSEAQLQERREFTLLDRHGEIVGGTRHVVLRFVGPKSLVRSRRAFDAIQLDGEYGDSWEMGGDPAIALEGRVPLTVSHISNDDPILKVLRGTASDEAAPSEHQMYARLVDGRRIIALPFAELIFFIAQDNTVEQKSVFFPFRPNDLVIGWDP